MYASKLGQFSTFTGYNGMRLGDEVQAAPRIDSGTGALRNQGSTSVISAYGSQGMPARDNSQILNMTPLQGMTSALTNSNLKAPPAAVHRTNSHSLERTEPK